MSKLTDYIEICNWGTFQHYKDRNPPWIKLHRSLLLDYDFQCLQDDSKLLLMLLWLLASQLNNKIPSNTKYIKDNLHIKKVELQPLISAGFIACYQSDSELQADCPQDAMPETETETEAYKPEETKYSQTSDEVRLASILFSLILERKPDYKKPNIQKWAGDIDKMIRIDNRKPAEIEKVIRWCQADGPNGNWNGWQNNVLSCSTLRKQFDKLGLAMNAKKPEPKHDKFGRF